MQRADDWRMAAVLYCRHCLGQDVSASRAIFFLNSAGLHRLDAGSCLPADVSDPLL
jgi:hypothetical protein